MIKSINEITSEDKTESKAEWFKKELEKSYIDLTKQPKKPKGLISVGLQTYAGKTSPNYIFTKGELSCISAPSKSFKSTFKSHLASAFFSGQSEEFQNIKGHRDKGECLVDIDTEQGEFYAWHTFNRTNRLTKYDISKYYKPFKLRHLTPNQRVDFIDILLNSEVEKPALIFVDGIADLIDDSNDLVMSNEIVSKVMRWTDDLKVHVCVVIHNAYGTIKPTGHLGSATVKKAETVLNIQEVVNENNIGQEYFKITHQYSRGARFSPFYFKNNPSQGCLEQVDEINNTLDSFDTF